MNDLEYELRRLIKGDIRFDKYSRLLYSTDASMYQVEPIGVVIPADQEDVQAVASISDRLNVPLLSRGAGTSLTGQAVNNALVIDFSTHLNRIVEINRDEMWVRVEPGVVQDQLNSVLKPFDLLFGPDTATSNRATIGGMIGNNSAGAHSIAYGMTKDHLIEITAILSDGSRALFSKISSQQFEQKTRLSGLEGEIYRGIASIRNRYRDEIESRYKGHWRRVAGYNLDEIISDWPLNMPALIAGSEGTLLTIVEARLKLVPRPRMTAVVVIQFRDLLEALECSQYILETTPYAVELIDKTILDLARQNLEQARRVSFLEGDPRALLLVEYSGDSESELHAKLEALEQSRTRNRFGYASHLILDPKEQQSIWKLRKAGLGLLLGMKGDAKPIAFVEDTAVDPKHLSKFVPRFGEILRKYSVDGAYYGHCSVGCLHIRPIINLKSERSLDQIRSIAHDITDLVMEFGGTISSEHGDGRARSPLLKKVYGESITSIFSELKAYFDPKNMLNPGNIVSPSGITDNLRFGPQYRTEEPLTVLDFSSYGGMSRAVEMCNGVGVCRKTLEGTMCPSYMVTRDEEHSTRGRANALRSVLSGKTPDGLSSKRLYEVMDLCIECKGCKAECPSNVDMARLKYEFLYHYYKEHGLPLRNRFFGNIEKLSFWGSRLRPLSNIALSATPIKFLLDSFLGLDKRRRFPRFAAPFTRWFDSHKPRFNMTRGDVVLFNDTFMTYNSPELGIAAVEILEAAGYRVNLVDKRCCGRPFISKGMLDEAREVAKLNIEQLTPWVSKDVPVIGLEPSCILTMREEWLDLVKSEEAQRVATNSFMLEEFLLKERERGLTLNFGDKKRAILHAHCHQKAIAGSHSTLEILRWANFEVEEVDSGCCGMAGSFGYEKEHYDISVAMAQRRLIPFVNSQPKEVLIAGTGTSCREQIAHLSGREVLSPVELIRQNLKA
jgi:FAD/FMN-containing dehydrogenase/Fe-S oxidoreductase